jgi:hypothetical protein
MREIFQTDGSKKPPGNPPFRPNSTRRPGTHNGDTLEGSPDVDGMLGRRGDHTRSRAVSGEMRSSAAKGPRRFSAGQIAARAPSAIRGAGADVFHFQILSDSVGPDLITNFKRSQGDKLEGQGAAPYESHAADESICRDGPFRFLVVARITWAKGPRPSGAIAERAARFCKAGGTRKARPMPSCSNCW